MGILLLVVAKVRTPFRDHRHEHPRRETVSVAGPQSANDDVKLPCKEAIESQGVLHVEIVKVVSLEEEITKQHQVAKALDNAIHEAGISDI